MGTQFWWFYDVIAGAILLISIFAGSKSGVKKSVFYFAAALISVVVAMLMSDTISENLCKGPISSSNSRKIENEIDTDTFVAEYIEELEDMGYSIRIDASKFEKALKKEGDINGNVADYINDINGHNVDKRDVVIEKVRESFGIVISDTVSRTIGRYAAITAAKTIKEDTESMQELIPLLLADEENMFPAAGVIADKYVSPAYKVIGKLVAFLIVFALLFLIIMVSLNAFYGDRKAEPVGMASHITGGIFGILTAVPLIFAAAVCVRLWAVMGNDEMLFFNNAAVDKTYVFRYFYEFLMKF